MIVMTIRRIMNALVVYLIVTTSVSGTPGMTDEQQDKYDKAKDSMLFVGEAFGMLALMGNATALLGGVGKVLTVLGPTFGIVGNLLSLVMVFMPQKDPIIEKLDEEFGKLNARLDNINYKLDWLSVLTEYQTAKEAYRRDLLSVVTVKGALDTFMKSSIGAKREARRVFRRMYKQNFPKVIEDLYRGIVELQPASLGVDLIEVYAKHNKCNAVKVAELCADLGATFTKGMEVVAAFHALNEKSNGEYLEQQKRLWQTRMQKFGDKCQAKIDSCIKDGWKTYIEGEIDYIFKEKTDKLSDLNGIAEGVRLHLDKYFPQQLFFAAVHTDFYGYDKHGVWGTNYYIRWHQKYTDKALTVGTIPVKIRTPPSTFDITAIRAYVNEAKRLASSAMFSEGSVTSMLASGLKSVVMEDYHCGYSCGPNDKYYKKVLIENKLRTYDYYFNIYLVSARYSLGVSMTKSAAYQKRLGEKDGLYCCRKGRATYRNANQCDTKCGARGKGFNQGDARLATNAIYLGRPYY